MLVFFSCDVSNADHDIIVFHLLTNIDVQDSGLVPSLSQFSLEISTINLARNECVHFHCFHAIHACSFEYRIVRVPGCIQNPVRKDFPPATIGFKEIDDSAQMIHCLEEDTIAKNR